MQQNLLPRVALKLLKAYLKRSISFRIPRSDPLRYRMSSSLAFCEAPFYSSAFLPSASSSAHASTNRNSSMSGISQVRQRTRTGQRRNFSSPSKSLAPEIPLSNEEGTQRKYTDEIWDNLLKNVDPKQMSSELPARRIASKNIVDRVPSRIGSPDDLVTRDLSRFPRRQKLTLQESGVFAEIFTQIFNAKMAQQPNGSHDPLSDIGIGRRPGEDRQSVDALYGKLRRRSKRLHDPREAEMLIEKLRNEMEQMDTDRQLLDWAHVHVFNANGEGFPANLTLARPNSVVSTGQPVFASKEEEVRAAADFVVRAAAYPHLLASLIAHFRDKFRDPHLALFIFDYARHLSTPSYVCGCTAPVYNELITTRWTCFRDLVGVIDALTEMRTNSVPPDTQTRKLGIIIKREALDLVVDELDSGSGLSSSVRGMVDVPAGLGKEDLSHLSLPAGRPVRVLLSQMENLISLPERGKHRPDKTTSVGVWQEHGQSRASWSTQVSKEGEVDKLELV